MTTGIHHKKEDNNNDNDNNNNAKGDPSHWRYLSIFAVFFNFVGSAVALCSAIYAVVTLNLYLTLFWVSVSVIQKLFFRRCLPFIRFFKNKFHYLKFFNSFEKICEGRCQIQECSSRTIHTGSGLWVRLC